MHSFLTLFAALSTVALYDVFLGSSGSFKVVMASTSGQQKAFKPLGINLAKMLPETSRQESTNRTAAKRKLRFVGEVQINAVACELTD